MDLSRPDRRERLDLLAAEYALGTLHGRARARFARVARADRTVGDAAREWERRLAALAIAVPGITPPPRVWTRIVARLGLHGAVEEAGLGLSWWQRLGFWRGFALASFTAALALSVLELAGPVTSPAESLVVVLAGPDARPAMIATAGRGERILTMKALVDANPGPGRSFELWALPEGSPPQSLGVIAPGAVARIPLRGPSGEMLAQVPQLAVSLEPAGGSPTGQPTGPVHTGRIERFY